MGIAIPEQHSRGRKNGHRLVCSWLLTLWGHAPALAHIGACASGHVPGGRQHEFWLVYVPMIRVLDMVLCDGRV